MPKFKTFLTLFLICLLGFIVLSYKLSEVPNEVYLDEATTGYNAYSILKTGKDEYGKSFPLAFRFFGSFTPPLYVYLTTLPVKIMGLTPESVRIISVFSGVLMILVIYGFLKQSKLINEKIIPLCLLLLIITPWNFFYARTGYELYLGFFLFSLGTLVTYLGLKQKLFLTIGFSILSLSTYASHPQIYSVPLFIVGFIFLFRKQTNKSSLLYGLIATLIIQIPHLMLLQTNAFLNKSDLFYSEEIITNAQKIPLSEIISIPLSFSFSFFSRVITYFSPYSLFLNSDPDPQRSIPELSVFYSWMVIPFFIGIYFLIKNIKQDFSKLLILLIAVTVLPASLTHDPFSTQRALGLLLPLFIIICVGLSAISQKLSPKKLLITFGLFFVISLILLWRSYFVLLPSERSLAWNYGYQQISEFISQNPDKHFVVELIKGKPSYIELAFFLKLDPLVVQKSSDPEIKNNYYGKNEFNPNYAFLNIQTRNLKWEEDIYKDQVLIGDELVVSPTQAKEHFLTEIFNLNDPRGYPVVKAFKTNPQKKCQATNNFSPYCKNFQNPSVDRRDATL